MLIRFLLMLIRFLALEVDFWRGRWIFGFGEFFWQKMGFLRVFWLNFGFRVESGLGNWESLWVFFFNG